MQPDLYAWKSNSYRRYILSQVLNELRDMDSQDRRESLLLGGEVAYADQRHKLVIWGTAKSISKTGKKEA